MVHAITYSDKYFDTYYEYRHVILPNDVIKLLPKENTSGNRPLMSELEWRAIGVQQSRGWEHYMWHKPSPEVLLFRRPLNYQQMQDQLAQQQQQQQQVSDHAMKIN